MKIEMRELFLSLTCLSLSFSVFAATQNVQTPTSHRYVTPKTHATYKGEIDPVYESPSHFELIGAGGIAAASVASSYLQVTSSETDTLKQTNSNQWNDPAVQLGAGYVFYLVNGPRISNDWRWFPTIEPMLNLYYSRLDVKGDVYRFEDPAFNDFSYRSVIQSTRLMVDGALTIVSKGPFSLYVLGGVGESWYRISYSDQGTSSPPCSLSAVDLDDRNKNSCAWDLGGGVAYAFNPAVSLSLEYLYTNLGTLDMAANGKTGSITAPQLDVASARTNTQSILLGLHVALS
jgi:opacity protein-like surface antigen